MRIRVAAALAGAAVLLTACSEEPEPVYPEAAQIVDLGPGYDASLEPAAAALSLVPEDATRLAVTDFERIRLQLGVEALSAASTPAQRDRFWARVATESPALSQGLLRPDDDRLAADYGFVQDDVEWEAVFTGPSGDGWVIKLRDDLEWDGVARAVADGVGTLAGSTDYEVTHIVSSGITVDPTASWRVDPALVALTRRPNDATYVERGCVPFELAFGAEPDALAPTPADELETLEPLGPFALTFGGTLVTADLGEARSDVFVRARIAEDLPRTDPDFAVGYVNPVADPASGRIGWTMADPAVAARLAIEQRLPFAVCDD